MVDWLYVSNMIEAKPVPWQKAQLGDRLAHAALYSDHLTPSARRNRPLGGLRERHRMIESAQPGDRIIVAALACFLFDANDLVGFAADAQRRNLSLHALDSNFVLPPMASPVLIAQARDILDRERRGPARALARAMAIANKARQTRQRADVIAPDWPKRDVLTKDLLKRVPDENGHPLSYATARKLLGDRREVQARYDAQQAANAALAEPVDE